MDTPSILDGSRLTSRQANTHSNPAKSEKSHKSILHPLSQVAFHALKFTAPIQELGDKLAAQMWSQGSYLAVHLRLEKDVWVRTGCLPGLGKELDEEIRIERRRNPRLLTAHTRMGFTQRKLAGLCPLTAAELVRYQ